MSSLKVKRGNVYKVAYIGKRKDAKRHLIESFQAENITEASERFIQILKERIGNDPMPGYEFQLLTGNWKVIFYTDALGMVKGGEEWVNISKIKEEK